MDCSLPLQAVGKSRSAQKDDLPGPCGPTMACVRVDFYRSAACNGRDFFIDNLLIRIHYIIVMIR